MSKARKKSDQDIILDKMTSLVKEDLEKGVDSELSTTDVVKIASEIFKHRSPDVDLQKDVFSLKASLELLPNIESVDKRCHILESEMLRMSKELSFYKVSHKEMSTKIFKDRKNGEGSKFFFYGNELEVLMDALNDFMEGIIEYAKVANLMNIERGMWENELKRVQSVFYDKIKDAKTNKRMYIGDYKDEKAKKSEEEATA